MDIELVYDPDLLPSVVVKVLKLFFHEWQSGIIG
jgi:hypothetical protein